MSEQPANTHLKASIGKPADLRTVGYEGNQAQAEIELICNWGTDS